MQLEMDSRFLNSLNGSCERHDLLDIGWADSHYTREITKAWASVGIEANLSFRYNNTYKRKDTGQSLSQAEARQYSMNYLGRQLKESDWKW